MKAEKRFNSLENWVDFQWNGYLYIPDATMWNSSLP
jgi:hypothetical protein